ncbi:MAG: hypothetical protein M3277_09810 [Actinomycetota bacterium]|nr:hypothetical protein [Actinomycetota bacterium]
MARNIADMNRLDLPIDQVLDACLPDVATDPSWTQPDPMWLRGLSAFEAEGRIDSGEFQADLIWSVSGLSR